MKNIRFEPIQVLWQAIIAHKILIIGMPVIFSIFAAIIVFSLQARWEASVVLRIGQIVQMDSNYGYVGPTYIEPMTRVVERLRSGGFLEKIAVTLDMQPKINTVPHLRKRLTTQIVHNSDLIHLRIEAESAQSAYEQLRAIALEITNTHLTLTRPIIDRNMKLLNTLATQLAEAKEAIKYLGRVTQQNGMGRVEIMVIESIRALRSSEVSGLQKEIRKLEERIEEMRANSTTIIEPIIVTTEPVWPKKGISVSIGALLGVISGLLLALILGRRNVM